MCFRNSEPNLKRFRNRKRPIKVWKLGIVSYQTGEVTTSYFGKNITKWEKGATVKPHQKRAPLKDKQQASAGLYFHTGPPKIYKGQPGTIEATVDPKDVIAVNADRSTICVTKATVINDPHPQWKQIRKGQLERELERAKEQLQKKVELIREWSEGGREDWEEAYQQMKDELAIVEQEIKDTKTKPKKNRH